MKPKLQKRVEIRKQELYENLDYFERMKEELHSDSQIKIAYYWRKISKRRRQKEEEERRRIEAEKKRKAELKKKQ